MTQKRDDGIPTKLLVGCVEPGDLSDEELDRMTDRELSKLGVLRLEISLDNFTDEELARVEALEAEGYSPSYIFNTGLEAIDRTYAHEMKQIFSTGLAKLETDREYR